MRGRASYLPAAVFLTLAASAAVAVSCGTGGDPPSAAATVTLAPSVIVPQGISGITNYRLQVFAGSLTDSGVDCSASTPGGISGNITETPIFSGSDSTGSHCGGGDAHCFENVIIPQSIVPRVFWVTGYSKVPQTAANLIAQGCTTATLVPMDASSKMPLSITMNPIQSVTSMELPLSGPKAMGAESNPSFVWPQTLGSTFFGMFGDTAAGSSHIALRPLDGALAPTSAFGPAADARSVYLPTVVGAPLPPAAPSGMQTQPAAVEVINSYVYVAFTSQATVGGPSAIHLRSFDPATLGALENADCPISDAAGDAGATGNASAPAIAVTSVSQTSAPILYVAWQTDNLQLYGRTYTPPAQPGSCGTLGPELLLSPAGLENNSQVALAGIPEVTGSHPAGWVAIWKSGADIRVEGISINGSPATPTRPLQPTGHSASSPTITSIAGTTVTADNLGAFAIAWADTSGGNTTIYAQRYSNQAATIDNMGTQISQSSDPAAATPVIAASPAVVGSYVVTWVDASGGNTSVRARLLAGGGGCSSDACYLPNDGAFLHNALDGTTGEFVVSVESNRSRSFPTVVAGGGIGASGSMPEQDPSMAFGWVDSKTGVVVRKFPLPIQ